MARWIEIRSERGGERRTAATLGALREIATGAVTLGGIGVVICVCLAAIVFTEPLSLGTFGYAAGMGFGWGALIALVIGSPQLIKGLAADAGEALSVAVEDRRTRRAHAADPTRGALSEPVDEHAGRLSGCDEQHGLSEPEP